MGKFIPKEKRIINPLYVAHRPLTTKQISKKLGIVWKTAKDNLTNLYKKGYVKIWKIWIIEFIVVESEIVNKRFIIKKS